MKVFKPDAGNVWNPMWKYPPNDPCPCGSGKKWKKCHRQTTAMCVSEETAKTLKTAMKYAGKK